MSEEDKEQATPENQDDSDSEEGGDGEQENKISGLEAGLVVMLLAVLPDLVELGIVFVGLDDFWISDAIFFTSSEIYAASRKVDGRIYARAGNIAELVPYVGALPLRTIGWSAAFYAHNHPNSWLGKKISKIGEQLSKIEKVTGAAKMVSDAKGGGGSGPDATGSSGETGMGTSGEVAKSGSRRGVEIEKRNQKDFEGFNKSNEELFPGQSQNQPSTGRGEGGGESINPELMGAMSEMPKMETHGFPQKTGVEDEKEPDNTPQKTAKLKVDEVGDDKDTKEGTAPVIPDMMTSDNPVKNRRQQPTPEGWANPDNLKDNMAWMRENKPEEYKRWQGVMAFGQEHGMKTDEMWAAHLEKERDRKKYLGKYHEDSGGNKNKDDVELDGNQVDLKDLDKAA
ncbi:MAG TPA: hypothetical protein VJL32_00430 [Candidatus Paceibacterota bacterium]